MNEGKIIEGLKLVIEGLSDKSNPVQKQEIVIQSSSNLAIAVAESYQTYHSEYGVDSLYKDIVNLATNSDKVGILIGWIRKRGITGFEDFFKESKDNQQKLILNAVNNNESNIKDILKRRFSK